MQKRKTFLPAAGIFILISLILLFFFSTPVGQKGHKVLTTILTPLQRSFMSTFGMFTSSSQNDFQREYALVLSKLVQQEELKKEIQALRDQFQTTTISSKKLLPAKILSARGFIPGVSFPEELILDKGKDDGVENGMVVIYQDNLVGIVKETSARLARVMLVSNSATTFAAKTLRTNALGIVEGQGNGIIVLKNVVLSDKLEEGDIVVTKGDIDEKDRGIPPDIVVGKIISVEKKPSDLFQAAQLQTLLDIPKLSTVFILIRNR